MKGNYSGKNSDGDSGEKDPAPKLENGKDYNEAGSDDVGKVDSVDVRQDEHSMPTKGQENSVVKNYHGGRLIQEGSSMKMVDHTLISTIQTMEIPRFIQMFRMNTKSKTGMVKFSERRKADEHANKRIKRVC